MARQIYVNLAVRDLARAKQFFAALGFALNEKFSNEDGACVIISDDIYAMLLTREFFKRFTKKEIADSTKTTEVLLALSAESRTQVDKMVDDAVKAGGKVHRDPEDHGWMYSQCFEDLDGHLWEVFWMDPTQAPA